MVMPGSEELNLLPFDSDIILYYTYIIEIELIYDHPAAAVEGIRRLLENAIVEVLFSFPIERV